MSSVSWKDALLDAQPVPLNTKAIRCVESQEKSATLELVGNDLDAHEILESLVEHSKPKLPENCQKIHYLLSTPFRYPPLKWGSRFGSRSEPSLMYAGLDIHVTLGECAFYRFVFFEHMSSPPPKPVITHHTSFSFRITGDRFLMLDNVPMNDFSALWTSKNDYSGTQALGAKAREQNFDGIVYMSARLENHRNIAIYSPTVISSKKPNEMLAWTCHTDANSCSFLGADNRVFSFEKEQYLVAGSLPQTAS